MSINIKGRKFYVPSSIENELNGYQYEASKELFGKLAEMGQDNVDTSELIKKIPNLDVYILAIICTPDGEVYNEKTYFKNYHYLMSVPSVELMKVLSEEDRSNFFYSLNAYITNISQTSTKAMTPRKVKKGG